MEHFERALQLDNENTEALSYVGKIDVKTGNYAKALKYFTEVINIAKNSGNLFVEQATYRNIGRVYSSIGDLTRATQNINNSLRINTQLGNKYGILEDHVSLGDAYISLSGPESGQYDALRHYEKAMEITREIGDRKIEAQVYQKMYDVHRKLNDRPPSNLV